MIPILGINLVAWQDDARLVHMAKKYLPLVAWRKKEKEKRKKEDTRPPCVYNTRRVSFCQATRGRRHFAKRQDQYTRRVLLCQTRYTHPHVHATHKMRSLCYIYDMSTRWAEIIRTKRTTPFVHHMPLSAVCLFPTAHSFTTNFQKAFCCVGAAENVRRNGVTGNSV